MNQNQNTPEKKKTNSKKLLKIGSLTVTTTAVVIAIFALLNLFVSELPSSVTKLDRSKGGLYSLSDESEGVIRSIGEDVHFYVLTQRGQENPYIKEILNRYGDLNARITWSTVDPASNPLFAKQYTEDALSDNSVIAVSGKRSFAVDASEYVAYCYTQSGEMISAQEYEQLAQYYAMYGQTLDGFEQQFMGDAKLAAAADYVTRDVIPVLYSVTGHGERALDESILSYIAAQNIGTEELSLMNLTALPEDCAAIYIGVPTADITEEELALLRDYAKNGGKILLVTGGLSELATQADILLNFRSEKMPNLTSLCADFGMKPADGIVVEGDAHHYIQYRYLLRPDYGASEAEPMNHLSRTNAAALSFAHGIMTDGGVTTILSTSTAAYVKKNPTNETLLTKEDGDTTGSFLLGAIGAGEGDSRMVWFSSPDIADPRVDYYGGNLSTFLAVVNWLTDSSHTMLSLPGRAAQIMPLMTTAADSTLWSIVFIGIIPAAVLGAGLVIWNRRRKK